jgi:hypothetical protein
MKHMTAMEIDRLHKQQNAALIGMKSKYQTILEFDEVTRRDMKPMTADGREFTKARRDARTDLVNELKQVLHGMNERKQRALMARPNWTRFGFMSNYRFAEEAEDSVLSNGKTLSSILNEITRLRIANEARLIPAQELASQADAAAAAGDWGSLRIYAMEVGNRVADKGLSGEQLRDAQKQVASLLEEVVLPSEQAESLTKIDEIEAMAENGLKVFYSAVGITYHGLKGGVPEMPKSEEQKAA